MTSTKRIVCPFLRNSYAFVKWSQGFSGALNPLPVSVCTSRVILGSSSGTSWGRRWRSSWKVVYRGYRVRWIHCRCSFAPPGSSWGRRRGPHGVADDAPREKLSTGVFGCAESIAGVRLHLQGHPGVVVGDLMGSPMTPLVNSSEQGFSGALNPLPVSVGTSRVILESSSGTSWGRRLRSYVKKCPRRFSGMLRHFYVRTSW